MLLVSSLISCQISSRRCSRGVLQYELCQVSRDLRCADWGNCLIHVG